MTQDIAPASKADEINLSPFFSYLGTERGHEIAKKFFDIFEGVKRFGMRQSSTHTVVEVIAKYLVFAGVVGGAVYLSSIGKFDSSVGVLFGTLIGYLFGKKQ